MGKSQEVEVNPPTPPITHEVFHVTPKLAEKPDTPEEEDDPSWENMMQMLIAPFSIGQRVRVLGSCRKTELIGKEGVINETRVNGRCCVTFTKDMGERVHCGPDLYHPFIAQYVEEEVVHLHIKDLAPIFVKTSYPGYHNYSFHKTDWEILDSHWNRDECTYYYTLQFKDEEPVVMSEYDVSEKVVRPLNEQCKREQEAKEAEKDENTKGE